MTNLKTLMAFGVVALALCVTPASVAAPPTNDDFANATVVTALPLSATAPIAEASQEAGEPAYWGMGLSVWYAFTPTTDAVLRANVSGLSYWVINAYRQDGSDMSGLNFLTGNLMGEVVFNVQAGSTYYIQAGPPSWWSVQWWETFTFSLESVPPPANDNFADSAPVTALPFFDSVDVRGATVESGEPTANCGGGFIRSVWYTLMPTESTSYILGASTQNGGGVNVYTGTSLGDLTAIACGSSSTGASTFHGTAGTTYYIQSGTWFDSGLLTTQIDVLPPPSLGISYGPDLPSTFDSISFQGQYSDPIGIDPDSWAWDFGDGATGTGSNPQHQYENDGDYNVTVTASTPDGRTSSFSQVLHIETHDVTMLSFVAPDKGRVGKPSVVTVGIGNLHYPENVKVDLYKITPEGDVYVGTSIQAVGVMKLKKSVTFSFNYVFTNEDLAFGKVTFKALAEIQGSRDAIPSDNAATASPTLVLR